MKALLLSAGLGTRLRPITNNTPKCLVEFNEIPLLAYWLENLVNCGVNEFLINTHYLKEKVESFVNSSIHKNKIKIVYEKDLLNTAGTLLVNKKFFNKNEAFLLIHADNLSFCDFNEFIETHNSNNNCEITMMLFETDTPKSCGIVELNEEKVVINFYEKVNNPPSNLANGAVYICNYTIFDFLEKLGKTEIDFSKEVIPNYLGKINTYVNNIYHRDIGTIESYKKAIEYMKGKEKFEWKIK